MLDGFAESEYPDWRTLVRALARQAGQAGWRGPLVIDGLPYLVAAAVAGFLTRLRAVVSLAPDDVA